MLGKVEVRIACQHIASAIKKCRGDFVARRQLLTDRCLTDFLKDNGGIMELVPTVFAPSKTELAVA